MMRPRPVHSFQRHLDFSVASIFRGNWGKIIEHLGIGCLKDDEAG